MKAIMLCIYSDRGKKNPSETPGLSNDPMSPRNEKKTHTHTNTVVKELQAPLLQPNAANYTRAQFPPAALRFGVN